MAEKVTTISDLLHRVASSCLSHRLPGGRALDDGDEETMEDYLESRPEIQEEEPDENDEEEQRSLKLWELQHQAQDSTTVPAGAAHSEKLKEMQCFVHEVFDAVSAVKRAYAGLQVAHSPWDPDKMRAADAAVVAELRKLGRLRDRFRRAGHVLPSSLTSSTTAATAAPLRDVVAPYEAAIDDLKRELKTKETEVESLKERLRSATTVAGSGRKGRLHSNRRVGCVTVLGPPGNATPEMFETYVEQVKSASKAFTSHLLSLMRAARWDIPVAVRSIVDGGGSGDGNTGISNTLLDAGHSKYALESYINRKLFQGFENETFYIEGSLGSLLNPADYRRDCFAQFRDMRGMDPAELLGVLPTCPFGRFAAKKYVAVVHEKLEEALFGSGEQRRVVAAGAHPRTEFYGEFLQLAKAVWLLHLLAFALDPPPAHFEASKGAEFHPGYMESVVRFAGGRAPPGATVGFSIGPGFKLGSGSVVRARVYVVGPATQPHRRL